MPILFSIEESKTIIFVLNSIDSFLSLLLFTAFPIKNHRGDIPSIKDKLDNFSLIS